MFYKNKSLYEELKLERLDSMEKRRRLQTVRRDREYPQPLPKKIIPNMILILMIPPNIGPSQESTKVWRLGISS